MEEGVENGFLFTLESETSYNGAGQPLTVNPPGFDTTDETSFTYDPARGNLVPTTRTDPLIGTTTFESDAFHRRVAVTDPNGVVTRTEYDSLDRVTKTIQEGLTPSEDLVTENRYTEFGDLFQTILPQGNVLEYGYDAAGRLVSLERKADADPATRGERTLFTLDGAGNRVKEELQSWDGSAWVTHSSTEFQYSTRCQLDRVVYPDGTATDYAYDCNGNLERVWDENHPRFPEDPSTPPPDDPQPDADPFVVRSHVEALPTQLHQYDELDRLVSSSQPFGGPGGGMATTSYAYDAQDHLVGVTDAEGNTTSYVYSDRDLLTRESSPVSGVSTFVYNEHGELVESTDARGVTTQRTVDELDRVVEVRSPDPALTTTFTYDDPSLPFSLGRLTSISRPGATVPYEYDVFGRVIRDGSLGYAYDANGNRVEVTYPGGVRAVYGYDFADRPVTLSVEDSTATQELVTSASYLPFGPLGSATLGNGVVESREFDSRYRPQKISLTGPRARTLDYQTDAVGNVTQIDEVSTCGTASDLVLENQTVNTSEVLESCASISASELRVGASGNIALRAAGKVALGSGFSVASGGRLSVESGAELSTSRERTYEYQDVQYFLTAASGPWGSLSWNYDTIGNRVSELRDGQLPGDTYHYVPNASMGNTAQLSHIDLSVGGTRDFTYGPAGHLEEVHAGANLVDFDSDDEGRLASLTRFAESATFTYDGRSFLASATEVDGDFVAPTYSSEGLLSSLLRSQDGGATTSTRHVFYFGDRPVASLETEGTSSRYTFLSTDHLGTPMVATDLQGEELWSGGFEPFGRDWQRGTSQGAEENEVFLRLPGQWVDGAWDGASLGAEVFYNVHRWYQPGTGRYTRSDPDRLTDPRVQQRYGYALQNPLFWSDPFGLKIGLVDPDIEPLLDCLVRGLSRQFRRTYVHWFLNDSNRWDFRVARSDRGLPTKCEAAEVGTRSCWRPPGVIRPGIIWVETPPDSSCEGKMQGLLHEMVEIFANRALGQAKSILDAPPWYRSPTEPLNPPAHNFALGRDTRFAREACCVCGLN